MKINKKQQETRIKISKLKTIITDEIGKFCESENYNVTYVEISAALIRVLNDMNGEEIKELWEMQ